MPTKHKKQIKKRMGNCLGCSDHEVINDRDPNDWQ